jgi:hypothetical protein
MTLISFEFELAVLMYDLSLDEILWLQITQEEGRPKFLFERILKE